MQTLMQTHSEHSLAIKVLGGPVDFYQLKRALESRLFPIKFQHMETSSTIHVIQLFLHHLSDKTFILENQPWVAGPHV
ncbi:hypothetical protein MKW92_022028, partial [Papaver armeniacum]